MVTIVHTMVTLLKPGIEKVLRLFYENKNQCIHLRETARKTRLYGQSVSRHLCELETKKILKSEREGNLKKYHLNKNQRVYSLLAFFDIERFEMLPAIRKNAIDHYLKKLEQMPVFVIIFGSTSKGTYREDSDIDILLVTNKKINTAGAEKEADVLTATKINTFQMTFQRFKEEIKLKEDAVVQSALFSGYPILNHITYYEVLYNEGILSPPIDQ